MIQYVSTKGGIDPTGFEEAVLQGFAADGGLFVPDKIPGISESGLKRMAKMPYPAIVLEMIRPFISEDEIPPKDLERIVEDSFKGFDHPQILPAVEINKRKRLYSMELFHGPTLSFKDIAMGFLVNSMDYLLSGKGRRLNLILATTGDTGPAAAHAAAGKSTLNCWPLYPTGMISKEQEVQMTSITSSNIHPVSVDNCIDGGDDLDIVVAKLFASPEIKEKLKLSSVNSINWCRVMVQAAHYAFGYFNVCDTVGEAVDFCVPSGAFGNLFAGFLAREMGIPIRRFICANNTNDTLHQVFSTGRFEKKRLCQTVSSAIDIVVPYNFWRFLYFSCGSDPVKIRQWMDAFEKDGVVMPDPVTLEKVRKGFVSASVSDEQTLDVIEKYYKTDGYLLDPHGAVAVSAAEQLIETGSAVKTVCLATAHPAKFPDVIKKALGSEQMSAGAIHPRIAQAMQTASQKSGCDLSELEAFLIRDIAVAVDDGI